MKKRSKIAFAIAFAIIAAEMVSLFLIGPNYAVPIFILGAAGLAGCVLYLRNNHRCPSCKQLLMTGNTFMLDVKFCPNCGAKID